MFIAGILVSSGSVLPAIGSQKLAAPTQLGEGNLNAVLISSSKGSSAAARPSSRKPNGFPGCSITCFNS
jgi:hypothetical protein